MNEFQPYIKPSQNVPEFTGRAVILGIILAVVFGAANAYVGLKVGMTVSASIPAAVISMAVLRGALKRGTILENNFVQAIGSSGEALAAGVIFTIPALFFLGFQVNILHMFIVSALGGCLGILIMIPLRHYLIVREHERLPYPEGTACARILVAGDQGGISAKLVFTGVAVGGIYKCLMAGLGLWKEIVATRLTFLQRPLVETTISMDTSPILLGVGYIIGLRIAAVMFAGALLGWLVLIPLIKLIGAGLQTPIWPANMPISELPPEKIWHFYIRYIGAGGVLLGGIVSIGKIIPVVVKSLQKRKENYYKTQVKNNRLRTERDLPLKWIVSIGLVIMIGILFYLVVGIKGKFSMAAVGVLSVIFFGGFFVAVSARIVGIVGSSSSPVSGMTLTALIATALIFVAFGWTDNISVILAMCVGAFICIAVCMSGDISQDLKTSYLVGATPWKVQLAEFIGALAPAVVIAWVLLLLNKTYGLGPGKGLEAPQATLLSMVLKGVITGDMPWMLIIIGIFIGLVVELLGVAALPFAIGLYLPFKLSAPIMVGGILAWVISFLSKPSERFEKNEKGVLFGSGLVAGDALMGVLLAGLASIPIREIIKEGKTVTESLGELINLAEFIPPSIAEYLAVGCFLGLAVFLVTVIRKR